MRVITIAIKVYSVNENKKSSRKKKNSNHKPIAWHKHIISSLKRWNSIYLSLIFGRIKKTLLQIGHSCSITTMEFLQYLSQQRRIFCFCFSHMNLNVQINRMAFFFLRSNPYHSINVAISQHYNWYALNTMLLWLIYMLCDSFFFFFGVSISLLNGYC